MLQFLQVLGSKKTISRHFTAYQQYKTRVPYNLEKFGRKVDHLLWIIHAKFRVNAAVIAGASLKKVNFTAFYSIVTA